MSSRELLLWRVVYIAMACGLVVLYALLLIDGTSGV